MSIEKIISQEACSVCAICDNLIMEFETVQAVVAHGCISIVHEWCLEAALEEQESEDE